MARGNKNPNEINSRFNNTKEAAAPTPIAEKEAVQAPVSAPEPVQQTEEAAPIVTLKDAANDFKQKMEAKKKKLRVEDTHTRSTFLVRNDLVERLDKLAKKSKVRGFKSEFINDAIEKMLDQYE